MPKPLWFNVETAERLRRAFHPATYFTRLPLTEFEQQAAKYDQTQKRKLALTGAAGAWRHAPMTRYSALNSTGKENRTSSRKP